MSFGVFANPRNANHEVDEVGLVLENPAPSTLNDSLPVEVELLRFPFGSTLVLIL